MNTGTLNEAPPAAPPSSDVAFAPTEPPAGQPPKTAAGVTQGYAPSPGPGGGLPKTPTLPSRGRMAPGNVRRGVLAEPLRILIYGSEKIGKSTFAAGAPAPIWIGADAGTGHLDIARMPEPTTLDELREAIHVVTANARAEGWQTMVLDPINWIEALLIANVVGDTGETLQSFGGGYGRGDAALMDRWRLVRSDVDAAWKAGLNVILCAHSATKGFNDPEGPGFDRYELAMAKSGAGMWKQWADAVLFAKAESYAKIDSASKKAKAYGSGERKLHTEWSPAYDAGNRMRLPAELPLSWHAFMEAKEAGATRLKELREQIARDLAELADSAITSKVQGWLADPKNDVGDVAAVVAGKLKERKSSNE